MENRPILSEDWERGAGEMAEMSVSGNLTLKGADIFHSQATDRFTQTQELAQKRAKADWLS